MCQVVKFYDTQDRGTNRLVSCRQHARRKLIEKQRIVHVVDESVWTVLQEVEQMTLEADHHVEQFVLVEPFLHASRQTVCNPNGVSNQMSLCNPQNHFLCLLCLNQLLQGISEC